VTTTAPATGAPGPVVVQNVGPRGVPSLGVPGRAALEVAAGPPPAAPDVADHVLSEYATETLDIRAASIRGLMHRHRGKPRQDAFSVVRDEDSETVVLTVCDGVGSLPRSHEAAALVTARLPGHYLAHRDWAAAVERVNDELRTYADVARAEDGEDDEVMATTLVAVSVTPSDQGHAADLAWTDDSSLWHLSPEGVWTLLTALPTAGPGGLHTGSVRALPASGPRLFQDTLTVEGGALFAMTDGVGVPLEHGPEVQTTLAGWWATPPDVFEFGRQVGFARKSHLDDRTVVGAWTRSAEGAPP
jgi:hypothetical protein